VTGAQIVVAAVIAAGLSAGCAGGQTTAEDSTAMRSDATTAPATTAPDGTKTAVDEAELVRFHLRGKELRVELLPGALLEDVEDLDGAVAVWAFYCQPRDFSEPSARGRPDRPSLPQRSRRSRASEELYGATSKRRGSDRLPGLTDGLRGRHCHNVHPSAGRTGTKASVRRPRSKPPTRRMIEGSEQSSIVVATQDLTPEVEAAGIEPA
jgi:hypothetical protein